MTTISNTTFPPTIFLAVDSELVDDFDDVDDVEGDEIGAAFVRSRMIQNEDGEWVYQLTERQLAAVERSRQDIAAGRVHSHEEVMARMQEWLR